MVETLKRRSALASVYVKGRFGADTDVPGMTVHERTDLTLVHIDGGNNDVKNPQGFKPPNAGQSVEEHSTRSLWMGPNRWLVISNDTQ